MIKGNEKAKKIEIFLVICLLLVGVLTFFSYPGITGHVSSDLNTQKVDLMIEESQVFEITADSKYPFYITSFRLSGSFMGDGASEIYLDNGQGQQLLVFSNIREKQTGMGGLTGITAKVIGADESFNEIGPEKYLVLIPGDAVNQNPINKPGEDEEIFEGGFESECDDTCFIEMEMSQDLSYNLIFKMEQRTKIHLTKIQYMIKEE